MKLKVTLIAICFSITFTSCDVLKQLGIFPSELEMAMGLKDGLTQGLFRGLDAFADPNGNPIVRFAFPGDAAKIEQTLRDIGMDKMLNQVTGKFTNAISSAITTAKPMFINSIKQMTIRDAVGILVTDNNRAATDYFKQTMQPQLMTAFRPIVDSTIKVQGANQEWAQVVNVYNKIPFTKNKLESSLTDFVSARAIDVMFNIIAKEEADIRTKYDFRKTDMMKKAFGYAEQELKRRSQSGITN